MGPKQLNPIRRVITGHDDQGKAIFESDTKLTPKNAFTLGNAEPEKDMGLVQIYRPRTFPANVQESFNDPHGRQIPLVDRRSASARVVDIAPGSDAIMHRTQSLDYGVVLSGEVYLVLDDGKEVFLKPHDVVVQRGTIHAWKNVGTEVARMFCVVLPSEKVKTEKGEKLEPSPFPKELDADEWDICTEMKL